MKNSLKLGLGAAFAGSLLLAGCTNTQTNERIEALEKQVAALEKKLSPARPQPPTQDKAYTLPMGQSPFLGSKDAPVSVVVFSDGQCPYCAGADRLLREVVKDPDLKSKVNVVFKNFPLSFHQDAKPAAKAALAAQEQGNEKFWAMMQKVFDNQRSLTPANFDKWAKEIGLNVTKFKEDLKKNDGKYEAVIKADMELGQNSANVRGTPSIYVGGWELRERSVEGVKNLIKEKGLI